MQQSNFIIFIGLLFASKERTRKENFDFCVEYEVLRKKSRSSKKSTPGEYKSDKKI